MFATPKNICGWWSMNSTAQLSGVNRPLSVELRLTNFCSCGLIHRQKHETSPSRGPLTKRSDFPRAKVAVRCSPFGGVELGQSEIRAHDPLGSLRPARSRERILAA